MRRLFKMLSAAVLLLSLAAFQSPSAGAKPTLLQGTDIVIDVGHGGIDSGTVSKDLEEKDINLAIAKILYEELTKKGYHTVLNRYGDYALSEDNHWLRSSRHKKDLAQRSLIANQLEPKLMISLHVNWSKKRSVKGGLVLHQNNSHSILLAHLLQTSLNRLYGQEKEPVPGNTFYILNHTRCPTVIVEMGFISNPRDREQLTIPEKQHELAAVIRAGIEQYFIYTQSASSR